MEFDDDLGLFGKQTSEDIHAFKIRPKRSPLTSQKISWKSGYMFYPKYGSKIK